LGRTTVGTWNQRRENFTLVREWLGLYATFMWATTQELGPHAEGARTAHIDLMALIDGFAARAERHEASRQLDETRRLFHGILAVGGAGGDDGTGDEMKALPVNDQDDECDFTLSRDTVGHMRQEAEEAGQSLLAELAETSVTRSMLVLGDAVARLAHDPHARCDKRCLEALRKLCMQTLNEGLRYTGLHPSLLREVKSLLWCLEHAVTAEGDDEIDGIPVAGAGEIGNPTSALALFSHTCTTLLSYRLDAVVRSPTLARSDGARWTSATLERLLAGEDGKSSEEISSTVLSPGAACAAGILRVVQASTMKAALAVLDARLFFPRDKVLCTQSLVTYGAAELSLSSCFTAGRRLLQMFRRAIDGRGARHESSHHCALARPHLLHALTLDVIESLRASLHTDARDRICTAVATARSALARSVEAQEVFTSLKALGIAGCCSDEFPVLRQLLNRCLDPLLDSLSLSSTDGTCGSSILPSAGRQWVYLGLMRLHLLLPTAPVDPSAKNLAKAALLEGSANQLAARAVAHHLSETSIGGRGVDQTEQGLLSRHATLTEKAKRLREKSIERPVDCPPFETLFLEMYEFARTLGGADRILGLVETCEAACAGVHQYLERDKREPDTSVAVPVLDLASVLETLGRAHQQVLNWQDSSAAFRTRLEKQFVFYEDVVSPYVSAVENISTGLTMSASQECCTARDALVVKSPQGAAGMARAWRIIGCYPRCASLSIQEHQQQQHNQQRPNPIVDGVIGDTRVITVRDRAVQSIYDLLHFSSHLASKTADEVQKLNNGTSSLSSLSPSTGVPAPNAVETVAPSVLLLLALAHVEFMVAGDIVSSVDVADPFRELLSKFIEHQLRMEHVRRQKAAEEAALFKYKPQENKFLSDDAAEDEARLKRNFPDHLSEFKEILNSMGGLELGGGEDTAAEEGTSAGAVSDTEPEVMSFDDACCIGVVSAHARMQLVYGSRTHAAAGTLWRRVAHERGHFAGTADAQRNAADERLTTISVVASRALSLSLRDLVDPALEAATIGGAVHALGSMAIRCLPSSDVSASWTDLGDETSWLAALGGAGVDRDLLYLMDHRARGEWNPLDFHQDPHPEEVRRAHAPLVALTDRIEQLLIRFPGNEILVLIFKLSARITTFHLATPLGKMLASLELLLRKAQEWEQYAAREYALTEYTQALARLVARWREEELSSWPRLLRCKEIVAAHGALAKWTSLARVLTSGTALRRTSERFLELMVRVGQFHEEWAMSYRFAAPQWVLSNHPLSADAAASTDTNAETDGSEALQFLRKIFDIVDGFMRGTVVGEFPLRLHTLRMFAIQLLSEVRTQGETNSVLNKEGRKSKIARVRAQAKEMLANLVYGLWQYYNAFLPSVRDFQERLRRPIYDKIRDEVKISKWDVLNTYSLLEHSDKVHRKLSRLIGEYQTDALDYPVTAVLRKVLVGGLYSEQGELESTCAVPADAYIFPPLLRTRPASPRSKGKAKLKEPPREMGATVPVSDDDSDLSYSPTSFPIRPAGLKRRLDTVRRAQILLETNALSTLPEDSKARRGVTLIARAHKYLSMALTYAHMDMAPFSARFAVSSALSARDMCTDIFERISSLRQEGVPKSAKKRAVSDLLRTLKAEGVSHMRADTSPRLKEPLVSLCLPAPLSLETVTDPLAAVDQPRDQVEKGELYYMRCLTELSEFRTQISVARHPDMTHQDAAAMMTLSDNLMMHVLRQRCVLRQVLDEARALTLASGELTASAATPPPDSNMGQNLGAHERSIAHLHQLKHDLRNYRAAAHVVLSNLKQLGTLLATAILAAKPTYMEPSAVQVRTADVSMGKKISARITALCNSLSRTLSATEGTSAGGDAGSAFKLFGGLVEGTDTSLGLGFPGMTWTDAMENWGRLNQEAGKLYNAFNEDSSLVTDVSSWLPHEVVGSVLDSISEWKALCPPSNAADFALRGSTDMKADMEDDEMDVVDKGEVGGEVEGGREGCTDTSEDPISLLVQIQDDVLIGIQRLRQVATRGASALERVAAENAAEFGTTTARTGDKDGDEEDTVQDDENEDKNKPSALAPQLPMVEALQLGLAAVTAAPGHRIATRLHRAASIGCPAHCTRKQWQAVVDTTLALVEVLSEARLLLLEDVAVSYQSQGKLLYVCLRVFRTLAAKGLCSSQEEEAEGDASGMSFEDDVEGTGMGEGDGKKDVSDQIDNEDQLSGLKNEEQKDKNEDPPEKPPKGEDDKAIEMTQDFEGDMHDISDDDNGEDDEEDFEDEREQLEREMGDTNEDDVVDEKQWDDKEDEVSGEEKMEKDSKTKGEEIEGEMTTKEDGDDDNEEGQKDNDKQQTEAEEDKNLEKDKDKDTLGEDAEPEAGDDGHDAAAMGEDEAEPNTGEEEMEKPLGVDVRGDEEKDEGEEGEEGEEEEKEEEERNEDADGHGIEEAQDGGLGAEAGDEPDDGGSESMDLPDDMQLDGDGDDESGMDVEDGEDEEKEAEDDNDDEDAGDDMEEGADEESPKENDDSNTAGAAGGGNEPESDQPEPEPEPDADADMDTEPEPMSANEDPDAPEAYGVQAAGGAESILGADRADGDGAEKDDAKEEDDEAAPTGGSKGNGGQQEEDGEAAGADHSSGGRPEEGQQSRGPDDVPNPLRERGDVNEKWHRRLNIEMRPDDPSQSTDEQNDAEADADDTEGRKDLYEYAGAEEGGTEQVLADADADDDGTRLPDKDEEEGDVDERKEALNPDAGMPEGDDDEPPPVDVDTAGEKEKTQRKKAPSKPAPSDEPEEDPLQNEDGECQEDTTNSATKDNDDEEDDDVGDDIAMPFPEDGKVPHDAEQDHATNRHFHESMDTGAEEDAEEEELPTEGMDERVAQELIEAWRSGAAPSDNGAARALWARYRSATDAHSIRLCEQLRLILEPSLATRLQGDYRTGKRINMKKVIGFIASGFRKDKIWLRRTKPAKRDYQVMLMIDDSSSMGQAGPLALASLTTIANALTKLEVGEMSVVSFADEVKQLHPFGSPFSDETGADVFGHFKFQATTTRLASSLEACVPLFEQARDNSASSVGSTTLQLCFVISDARIDTDNREDLHKLVRRMAEKHILVVLIIIDKNADEKDSIFNTQTISFTPQGIVTRAYLDGFPFNYYLTISNIERLPEVLSDALKQWFEMVRAQLDSR